jgi:hypothetical protein
VDVHYFVLVWRAPDLFVVLRCTACRRADVLVRWPEVFDFCDRCGGCVFTQPELRPVDGWAKGDETP